MVPWDPKAVENPFPTLLAPEVETATVATRTSPSRRQKKKTSDPAPSIQSPCHSQTSAPARKPLPLPDPKSPKFSPSGRRLYYDSAGISVKGPMPIFPQPACVKENEPTPEQYRDPTNPETPGTGRRERLASAERKRKRRKLDKFIHVASTLPAPDARPSSPLPMMELPERTFSSTSKQLPPEALNETFTDSDLEVEAVLAGGTASEPVRKKRGRKKTPVPRPHSALRSKSEDEIVKMLIHYRNK